jgi:transposase
MQLYSGYDLDATNAFIGNLDEDGKRIFKKKLRTGAEAVLLTLKPDFSSGFVNDPT